MKSFAVLVLLITMQSVARGDAIMVTRAMRATTILQMRIEEGGITVDLEIGVPDLDGFRNLLPDAIYEKIEGAPRRNSERLSQSPCGS